MKHLITILCLSWTIAIYGQFAPAAGQPGTTAIAKDSSLISQWAAQASVVRGYQDIANPSLGMATIGEPEHATGQPDGSVLSLGDGGQATVYFDEPLSNGIGPDLAVFENSFSDDFLELALVSVSSNGVDFFTFPAISNTDTTVQIGAFDTSDPALVHNLAGKYRANFGTPFDMDDISDHALLNKDSVHWVRVTDVIGVVSDELGTRDSEGKLINDPYPTAFASGGFDLDAVAGLGTAATGVSAPKTMVLAQLQGPWLHVPDYVEALTIYDLQGRTVQAWSGVHGRINLSQIKGLHVLVLENNGQRQIIKAVLN